MSSFEIKGNTKSFTKNHLKVIYDVLKRLNFEDKEISTEPFGQAGDNYSSELKLIKVKLSDDDYFNIIAKTSFVGLEIDLETLPTEMIMISGVIFNNEVTMYTEVLPLISELQENAAVPIQDRIVYAECYGAERKPGNEIILLEDLTKRDYKMLDKMVTLSSEGVKLVLGKLAIFHSLSHVLKHKAPEKYSELSKKFIDMNALEGAAMFQSHFITIADKFGHIFQEEKYRKIMKEAIVEYVNNEAKLHKEDSGSKYSVITHGDSWNNNVLFKTEDDKVTDCVLIDYQLSRESRPVTDIFYFVFNCTDHESRAKHYHEWLDHYHEVFGRSLSYFGLNINSIYPRDRFDCDLMRYAKPSLGRALITSAMLLRKPEEAAEAKEALAQSKTMDDLKEVMQMGTLQMETMLLIKGRIEGLINSCIDFGYWNN